MNKITDKDLANRGVKGLPDVPGLTTEEMQRKLEEIAREILVPKVNEIIDNLIAVNSNLSYQTNSYTCSYSSDKIIAERSGNVVTLILPNLLSTLPANENVNLATLDTKYAPIGNRQFRIADTNNSNEIIMITIRANGVVSAYQYGTGNYVHSTANATLTYLVSN